MYGIALWNRCWCTHGSIDTHTLVPYVHAPGADLLYDFGSGLMSLTMPLAVRPPEPVSFCPCVHVELFLFVLAMDKDVFRSGVQQPAKCE